MSFQKRLFFLISIFVLAFQFVSIASNGQVRRHLRRAENYFTYNKYDKALTEYLYLLQLDSSNFDFNYKTGLCYNFLPEHKDKSVYYFLKASKAPVKDTVPDLYYYLGASLQRESRFDEALQSYATLKRLVSFDQGLLDLDKRMDACRLGKQMIADPKPVDITNLGPNVNSTYPDYAPVLSEDESLLIFTSKRPGTTGGKKTDDFYYYEDVYVSHRQSDEEWKLSSKMDSTFKPKGFLKQLFSRAERIPQVNTNDHDACISLTPDGKKMYILRGGVVYSSLRNGDTWDAPVKVENFSKDSKDQEPSLTMTADGKTLFVVSDRKGGFGGKDIYSASLQADGTWGVLTNLGPEINTDQDEDGPFIQADTLYFSSQGHNSIGGYDVFKSVSHQGVWSSPVNLGYPVNTGGDDVFYVVNKKGDRAYYASEGNGTLGDLDLFMVEPYEKNPLIQLNVIAFGGIPDMRIPATVTLSGLNGKTDSTLHTGTKGTGVFKVAHGSAFTLDFQPEGYASRKVPVTLPLLRHSTSMLVEADMTPLKNASGKLIGQTSTFYIVRADLKPRQLTDSALNMKEERKASWEKTLKTQDPSKVLVLSYTDYLDTTHVHADTGAIALINNPDKGLGHVPGTGIVTDGPGKTDTLVSARFSYAPIVFDFSKNLLRPEAEEELLKITAFLKVHPEARLKIEGFTDSKGSDTYNLILSRKRANAAANYLVGKGVSRKRLDVKGLGENQPRVPNENPDGSDNPAGRQQNRRVEFRLLTVH